MVHRICFIALTFVLSACVSVLPEPQGPDALYGIDAPQAAVNVDADIIIREPDAPSLLAGKAVVSEDPTGAMRLVRDVEWSDRATRLMQRALLDAISPTGEGVALANTSASLARFELSWRLVDFQLLGSTGVCRIRATVFEINNGTTAAQTIVEAERPARSDDNVDRIRALSEAGTACVASVAGFLQETTRAELAAS